MQLSKLFTTILVALAGQALGAPDMVETSSVPSQASATTEAAAMGSADPSRLNLMCKPTGRGYCTIEIYSVRSPVSRIAILYDYKCDHLVSEAALYI